MINIKSINQRGISNANLFGAVVLALLLVTIVLLLINKNPDELAGARDTNRFVDVKLIRTVVEADVIKNPSKAKLIPFGTGCKQNNKQIARSYVKKPGFVNLSEIVSDKKFLSNIPTDPVGASTYGTGYYIYRSEISKRITVCAPDSETEEISVNI